jgi:ESS family glutamate:Na+ symporter
LLPLLAGGLEPGGWLFTGSTLLAAAALLTGLLLLGSLIGKALVLHQWGIPEALIAGSLGLLIAPDGALPLLPEAVIRCWDALPLPLLTLVFATLLLGKPLPRPSGLWRPLSAQVLMALTLAFGQYLVAGLAVLLLLRPLLGVSPVMACLIEASFEGGHGSAAAMGPTYERLGVSGATALGLALSTVGLLASTVVGGLVVVLARRVGWLASPTPLAAGAGIDPAPPNGDAEAPADQAHTPDPSPAPLRELRSGGLSARPLSGGAGLGLRHRLQRWALNLGLAGLAVAIGWVLLRLLRVAAPRLGGGVAMVVEALPVFPLALVGSLLIRLLVERCGAGHLVSAPIQNRVGSLSADLLIAAATACLDLSLLAHDWLPVLVLSVLGLAWNLAILLLLAPRLLPSPWFSRGIIEFGQATGVAASGLLLLNMADPQDQGDALTPFSIKQLLMQPLVAGGVVTVVAPLAVVSWGLGAWTALSLVVVLVAGGTGLWLGRGRRPA